MVSEKPDELNGRAVELGIAGLPLLRGRATRSVGSGVLAP